MAMMTEKRLDPATAFVRSLDGDYYMLKDVAKLLGVSQQTLRNYNKGDRKDELGPSYQVSFGKIKIYLYTKDDITTLEEYLNGRKKVVPAELDERRHIGRPAKWTNRQRKERQRAYSRAHYYKVRAKELIKEGKHAESQKALAKANEIVKQLKEMTEE